MFNNIAQVPAYPFEPDERNTSKYFRVYNFEGNLPDQSDLLIPHRKENYLLVFVKRAGGIRHWIDTTAYILKDDTIYFTGPGQVVVKEEFKQVWSTGIAFTPEFLSVQENIAISSLPIIHNPANAHELILNEADVRVVEDLIAKINVEYQQPGEWQHRMFSAYLNTLLTYLSRLYTEQFNEKNFLTDKLLLKNFQGKVNEHFREVREVGDYAAMLNISPGHLSEVVKMQSGKPAIKHIHERLVLEARRLLFHTSNSLKEIGFDLGFSDASYFNRFFKRETGVTPAEYRAYIREMYH
ncbi:helix-turn-helix domain-containing protein [Desertivirga xinjiangensis]|uniref:helix-turn-helix domain-containing protein n=1 Tax=Desertivirga xinjiangensis TaxID=539206 RepID=UPI00210E193B|nr:helix-turn-helix domain-containing protein [Pedobacter xinjiangensis]